MQPELLSLFYLINLTEKYVNSINPFDILKDNAKVKEFALVITNATAGYQNSYSFNDYFLESKIISLISGYSGISVIGGALNSIIKSAVESSDKVLLRKLLLSIKGNKDFIEKYILLIPILIGSGAHRVVFYKSNSTFAYATIRALFKGILSWNSNVFTEALVKNGEKYENYIANRVSEAILALLVNLYFSDANVSIECLNSIVSNYVLIFNGAKFNDFLSFTISRKFDNYGIGGKTIRDLYKDIATIKRYCESLDIPEIVVKDYYNHIENNESLLRGYI